MSWVWCCQDCGWIWPLPGKPPEGAECDNCGGELETAPAEPDNDDEIQRDIAQHEQEMHDRERAEADARAAEQEAIALDLGES